MEERLPRQPHLGLRLTIPAVHTLAPDGSLLCGTPIGPFVGPDHAEAITCPTCLNLTRRSTTP